MFLLIKANQNIGYDSNRYRITGIVTTEYRIIILSLILEHGISVFLGFQFPLTQHKQKRKDYNRNRDFYYVVTKYYQSNQLFRIFYSKNGGKSTEQDNIFLILLLLLCLVMVILSLLYLSDRLVKYSVRQNHYNFEQKFIFCRKLFSFFHFLLYPFFFYYYFNGQFVTIVPFTVF